MKHLFSLALLFSFSTLIAFADSQEKRDLPTFTSISLGVSATVHLKQGSPQSVELKGDRDDIEEIETEVSSGRLRIRREGNGWFDWSSSRSVHIYITMKDIDGLSVSGSGKMISETVIKSDELGLSVSGSGDLVLDIDVAEVKSSVSGSGDVELRGKCRYNKLTISGSGEIDALDLLAEIAEIRISGSGDAEVHASKEIEARVSGSGSIRYKGNPDKVNQHSSGSGRIRKY